MSKQSFDDIIRAKLSGFRSAGHADWHAFERMLTQRNAEMSDKSFDTQLARKLNAHGSSVPEGSWESFSQRHKLVLHLQSNLKSLKLVEACIVLLMLFILSGPIFHYNTPYTVENKTNAIISSPEFEKTNIDYSVAELGMGSVSDKRNDLKTQAEGSTFEMGNQFPKESEVSKVPFRITNRKLSTAPVHDIINDASRNDDLSPKNTDLSHTKAMVEERSASIFLQDIEKLRMHPFKIREDVKPLDVLYAPIRIYIEKRLDADYISLCSAFDNNFIHTPDDLEYNTDARKTEMFGYSIGLMYSSKRGAFEWLTGLMYSSLDKPWDFTLQYGDSGGWYRFIMTNLHFKMAGLPMELNYHLVENHEWSLIARLGVTHSFIMKSQYQTSNSYLGGGSIAPGEGVPEPDDGFSPFENERAFTKGLLQGGTLTDNYFMRSFVGGGIQRNISPAVAINLSAAYHWNIINTTIGPNNDRFDKFEISFGLKLRMR